MTMDGAAGAIQIVVTATATLKRTSAATSVIQTGGAAARTLTAAIGTAARTLIRAAKVMTVNAP
jgi:hypothetical protein